MNGDEAELLRAQLIQAGEFGQQLIARCEALELENAALRGQSLADGARTVSAPRKGDSSPDDSSPLSSRAAILPMHGRPARADSTVWKRAGVGLAAARSERLRATLQEEQFQIVTNQAAQLQSYVDLAEELAQVREELNESHRREAQSREALTLAEAATLQAKSNEHAMSLSLERLEREMADANEAARREVSVAYALAGEAEERAAQFRSKFERADEQAASSDMVLKDSKVMLQQARAENSVLQDKLVRLTSQYEELKVECAELRRMMQISRQRGNSLAVSLGSLKEDPLDELGDELKELGVAGQVVAASKWSSTRITLAATAEGGDVICFEYIDGPANGVNTATNARTQSAEPSSSRQHLDSSAPPRLPAGKPPKLPIGRRARAEVQSRLYALQDFAARSQDEA